MAMKQSIHFTLSELTMMNYLIFGAGAVGTLLGALLAKAGHKVFFIGRQNHMDAIRTRGIRISGLWGEHQVKPQTAYTSVEEIPENQRQFDQVLICTKTFDTTAAIEACLPVIQEPTLVISLQNGYGNVQIIADKIGWHRTLGARVITGVEVTEPGMINVTVHGDSIRLGHYLNEFPIQQLQSIALTFREAGVPLEATDQLEQYVWAKILYNAALNPLGALSGCTYGALAENQHSRNLMNQIIDEAFAVTSAHGIRQFWQSADEYREAFYQKMVPPTASHYPSMLRDLERNRRTEIDALNGAIVKLGEKKNIDTPVNQTIISLIRFREEHQ
jgi:2-dehydropantoate 2-reductase